MFELMEIPFVVFDNLVLNMFLLMSSLLLTLWPSCFARLFSAGAFANSFFSLSHILALQGFIRILTTVPQHYIALALRLLIAPTFVLYLPLLFL